MSIVTDAIFAAAIAYVVGYAIAKGIIIGLDKAGLVYHPRKD